MEPDIHRYAQAWILVRSVNGLDRRLLSSSWPVVLCESRKLVLQGLNGWLRLSPAGRNWPEVIHHRAGLPPSNPTL